MRSTEVCRAWVVYRMTLPKNVMGGNVVCELREWEAIEAKHPGYHTLLHSGIQTEREAELLARGPADEVSPPGGKKGAALSPLYTTAIPTQAAPTVTRRKPQSRAPRRVA